MSTAISRRRAIQILAASGIAPLAAGRLPALASPAWQDDNTIVDEHSGYAVQFIHSLDDLVGDLLHGERGDPRRESNLPHRHWYTHETRHKFGAWGPEQRLYEPLPGLEHRSLVWQRERVIATAARFIGYDYQHHHVPDWDPPKNWPWKHCCAGHNGRGVDCSNFTTFVYNQGFGIHMSSGIERQSEQRTAIEHHEGRVRLRRIDLLNEYAGRLRALHTGDLVYIRGREDGPVTHVVIWIGSLGRSPSGVPLIMDSHGGDVDDDSGRPIPCGIHLRPFREDSWYNRCASHAHRIFG